MNINSRTFKTFFACIVCAMLVFAMFNVNIEPTYANELDESTSNETNTSIIDETTKTEEPVITNESNVTEKTTIISEESKDILDFTVENNQEENSAEENSEVQEEIDSDENETSSVENIDTSNVTVEFKENEVVSSLTKITCAPENEQEKELFIRALNLRGAIRATSECGEDCTEIIEVYESIVAEYMAMKNS